MHTHTQTNIKSSSSRLCCIKILRLKILETCFGLLRNVCLFKDSRETSGLDILVIFIIWTWAYDWRTTFQSTHLDLDMLSQILTWICPAVCFHSLSGVCKFLVWVILSFDNEVSVVYWLYKILGITSFTSSKYRHLEMLMYPFLIGHPN